MSTRPQPPSPPDDEWVDTLRNRPCDEVSALGWYARAMWHNKQRKQGVGDGRNAELVERIGFHLYMECIALLCDKDGNPGKGKELAEKIRYQEGDWNDEEVDGRGKGRESSSPPDGDSNPGAPESDPWGWPIDGGK